MLLAVALCPAAAAASTLENPQPWSFQSGIGVISGWACPATSIGVSIDGATPLNVPYGSARPDTSGVCTTPTSGFGAPLNFNRLGAGLHTAQLSVNGVAQASPISFRVTIPAGEFATGLNRTQSLANFPFAGQSTTLLWQQA